MTVRFSDFAAFVIAACFVVAVFVAPYIMAWHYLDSHFSRMAEHDSRPLAEGSGLVLPGAPNAPSRPRIAVLHTGEKGGAMLHSSGQNRTLPSRTEVPSGECWSPVTQRGGLELGQKLCVTDRRDGRLEDCSLGQRATSSQLRPLDRTARTILRLPLVGSLQGEREKPETGNRSTGESASAVVQLPIRDNRRKHTEMRVPSRPELEHSLRVTKGSGLPDPASSLCWGREQGASEYGVRHAPGSLDAIEAGRGLAFGDGAARWISEVTASAVDRTDRSRDPVRPPVQQDGKAGAPSPSHLQTLAGAAANLCGIDPALFWSLVLRESSGRHWDAQGRVLRSSSNALGLGQIKASTARGVSPLLDPLKPWDNAVAAACHLRALLDANRGNVRKSLHDYHAGAYRQRTSAATLAYASDILSTGGAQ